MAFNEGGSVLLSDKPLLDPKDDQLGYAQFAKNLAEIVCKVTQPEGLVIAIHGPWGSGKTTLLNFITHYLKQKPKGEQPIIVHFNPWWFSEQESLIRQFIEELLSAVAKWEVLADKLKEYLYNFCEVHQYGRAFKPFLRQKSVAELKHQVVEMLKKQKKKIVIIIDDIDRLNTKEIKQLFRLVKAVMDFPNVIYLLAFDKKVVIQALSDEQGVPAEAYLEKIVQLPLELPLLDKTSLRHLFFEKLDAILADTPSEMFDRIYWSNVYFGAIDHFINTPRAVVRFINTLSVTYPAVKGEVNAVDFVAIEAIRVFCPLAYDIIRKNPGVFTGVDVDDNLKLFHESWLAEIPEKDREPIKVLLKHLFPKLEAIWENTHYPPSWLSTWRKQRRVCSPDVFHIYFHFAVPEWDISNAEMKAFLALAQDPNTFGRQLLQLANQKRPDGTTRVRVFLERLWDYSEKEIPLEYIPSVIQAFFDIGDKLLCPEDEPRRLADFGNDIRIMRVIWRLLRRLSKPERFEILKLGMAIGESLSIIVKVLRSLQEEHRKDGAQEAQSEDERLVDAEHLQELENVVLENIRNAAKSDVLLDAPKLPTILYFWRDLTGEEEVKKWVSHVISSDELLVKFIEKFLTVGVVESLSTASGVIKFKLDLKSLEPFCEPSEVADRLKKLVKYLRLTENQKAAVMEFLREYKMIQEKEKSNAQFAEEEE